MHVAAKAILRRIFFDYDDALRPDSFTRPEINPALLAIAVESLAVRYKMTSGLTPLLSNQ